MYINLDGKKPENVPQETWDALIKNFDAIYNDDPVKLAWHEIERDGWYQYECPYCHIHHAFATEICPHCGRPLDNSHCTMV